MAILLLMNEDDCSKHLARVAFWSPAAHSSTEWGRCACFVGPRAEVTKKPGQGPPPVLTLLTVV